MISPQRLRDTLLPRVLAARIPHTITQGPSHDRHGRPLLYLTVDDGPDATQTPRWLDALARHDAHAVFFLSAPLAKAHPDLVRQMAAVHRVGSHGGPHTSAWRMRPAAVRASFEEAEQTLERLAGAPVRDVRPPYGRVTPGLVRWVGRGDRRLVLWDVMPGDFLASRTPDALAREIVETVRPGSIVALHDGAAAERAVAAIDRALPVLAAAGWRFPLLPARR